MIIGYVAQGIQPTVVRALFCSSVKGLLLTFGGGILIRFLRSPPRALIFKMNLVGIRS